MDGQTVANLDLVEVDGYQLSSLVGSSVRVRSVRVGPKDTQEVRFLPRGRYRLSWTRREENREVTIDLHDGDVEFLLTDRSIDQGFVTHQSY